MAERGTTSEVIERLKEWAVWYHARKKDNRSLEQQIAFNNTMIDGMMELIALLTNQIVQMKGRQLDGSVLWAPRDLRVTRTEQEQQLYEDIFYGRRN